MAKEVYFDWTKYDGEGTWNNGRGSEGGVIRLQLKGFEFIFEWISGSAIPTEALVGLMWCYPGLKDFRDTAAICKRPSLWAVHRRDGKSGCTDWYIQQLKRGRVCSSSSILHSSMKGKQNQDIKCYIKDFYDVLWDLKRQGCYPESFSDERTENDCKYGYTDITSDVLSKREEFEKNAFSADVGFGCTDSSEEPAVDYSNYTPTEENKEELVDDNGIRPVVPVSSEDKDEDEYI